MPKTAVTSLLVIALFATPACANEGETTPAATPAPAPAKASATGRVVAVGDLHGDLDNALATLRLAGIVDATGAWAGGTTTFVQTGDTTDRGPDSKAILDLLWKLQGEAEAVGGKVIPLLGNHEVMNLQGDLRYVHPGDVTAFGGAQARAEALAPTGTYGKALAKMDIVALAGDAVFVHGGITPLWSREGVDGINRKAHDGLWNRYTPVLGEGGPLWYRGYVQEPEGVACNDLVKALDDLGAKRMVVGHTTRRDGRIQTRCDGRLHVIDVGIADHYGGNLAAWEWSAGDARALYPTGPVDLEDPS